jgi:hypothetical protein
MMGAKPKQTPCEKCRGYLLKKILGSLKMECKHYQEEIFGLWGYDIDDVERIITKILGESSRET